MGYGRWGKIDPSKCNIFSGMIVAKCGLAFSWRRKMFLLLMRAGCFLKRFSCACCSCWESKSAWIVGLQLENSKWRVRRWFHHSHSISFFLWTFAFGLNWGNSSPFAFNIINFLWPVIIFLTNTLFLCLERRLIAMDIVVIVNSAIGVCSNLIVSFEVVLLTPAPTII